MRTWFVRALVTFATCLVVWFSASPAQAKTALVSLMPPPAEAPADATTPLTSWAPLCDPRGATTLAPPPQRQDVELSLDTGLTLEDCMGEGRATTRHVAPGPGPHSVPTSTSLDPALPGYSLTLVRGVCERLPAPRKTRAMDRVGVRATVDRPPRV